jgi:hypothetical protein
MSNFFIGVLVGVILVGGIEFTVGFLLSGEDN